MRHWLRKITPDHAAIHGNRWLAPFRNTLLHPRLWHINRRSAAGGFAAGLFCGLIPGPFQMIGAAICAVLFRVNLPLALFTTLYTNPFTIVPLYILAYWLGTLLVGGHGNFVPPPELGTEGVVAWLEALMLWLGHLGLPLVVGVLLLAILLSVAGYLAVRVAWRIYLVNNWRRRRRHRLQSAVAKQ